MVVLDVITDDGSRTVEFDTSFLANLPDELKLMVEKADTVEELINKSPEDMMKVRNLGKKSLEEVLDKLKELNLQLKQGEEALS